MAGSHAVIAPSDYLKYAVQGNKGICSSMENPKFKIGSGSVSVTVSVTEAEDAYLQIFLSFPPLECETVP